MRILYLGVFASHCSDRYRLTGFQNCGFDCRFLDFRRLNREFGIKKTYTVIKNNILGFEPDLVFVNKGEIFKNANIKALRNVDRRMKWVLFYGDHILTLPPFLKDVAKEYDGILVETDDWEYCSELEKAGAKKVYYYHSATDPRVFKKLRVEEICDVSFFGNDYSTFPLSAMRKEMIQKILDSEFSIAIYGASKWYGHGKGMRWGADFATAASQSKIILGISTTDKLNKFASNRVWNSMAVGFHLTHYFKGIEMLFRNHHHLVWFKSIEEMMELIKFYSKNDGGRRRIYNNGRQLIQFKHSYYQRALELIPIYETL